MTHHNPPAQTRLSRIPHSLRTCSLRALALLPLLLVAAGALSGCNQTKGFPFGAITVTVKPGDTGKCAISPCRVLFQMPSGSGGYELLGNEVELGRYPAGKIVNLGDFYEPVAIEVVGADLPKAYVYIPVER